MQSLLSKSGQQRRQILNRLGPQKCRALRHSWKLWARTDQYWEPGHEKFTLYLAGRGWGKTRTGTGATNETAEHRAEDIGGELALIGKTPRAVREDMIEGPAGILRNAKPWFKPQYFPSKRRLVWPNGVVGHVYSAHNPAELRGPQVGFLWADELPHWCYPQKCWDEGVEMFLRHGKAPKGVVTTTPLPIALIIQLVNDPQVRVVNGSTADNVGNLAPDYIERVYARFAGTDIAAQELGGRVLDSNKRALWRHDIIKHISPDYAPGMFRTVVSIDPAGGSNSKKSDETGLTVVSTDELNNLYLREDASGKMPATEWAGRAISLAHTWGADAIVAEKNFGGDMVETTIRQHPNWTGDIEIQIVTATKSKGYRATPVAAIYQQGRGYHVTDDTSRFAEIEDQMTSFDPTIPRRQQKSPDRMDSLVWAGIALLGEGIEGGMLRGNSADGMEALMEDLAGDGEDFDDDDGDMFDL